MNLLANVIAFGLALAPGNPLFDEVSVELGRVPVEQLAIESAATAAYATWTAPAATSQLRITSAATAAYATWTAASATSQLNRRRTIAITGSRAAYALAGSRSSYNIAGSRASYNIEGS